MTKAAKIVMLLTVSTLASNASAAERCYDQFRARGTGARAESTARTTKTEATSGPEVPYPSDLSGNANPLLRAPFGGIAESKAFERLGNALTGIFKPQLIGYKGDVARYKPKTRGQIFGGVEYVEFPNSTSMTTVDPLTGNTREFILTRGVKPYEAQIDTKTGVISPQNYVSDVLLFERKADGSYEFVHRVLASVEAKTFFFEDPRISVLYFDGQPHYFLSGTDYSPHVAGAKDPDVMNRFVRLEIDARGLPKPVKVDAKSGKPEFMDLSPTPRMVDGQMLFIDAKNATLAQNEDGQLVIRMRLRPDFNHPLVKRLANGDRWDYAEQVFVFRDWNHFRSYNMNDAIVDLFGKRGEAGVETLSQDPPVVAKTIIRDSDLREHLTAGDDTVRIPSQKEKPKGMGPGTRPLRLQKINGELFASEGPGAPLVSLGQIPTTLSHLMKMQEGEVVFVTFDHEIRYAYQKVGKTEKRRRHYSASIKIFDRTLTNIVEYMPDVIQPKTKSERGLDSGILDLLHVYPMGWVITTSAQGKPVIRVYAGASDAHTTIYDFDMIKLLTERR